MVGSGESAGLKSEIPARPKSNYAQIGALVFAVIVQSIFPLAGWVYRSFTMPVGWVETLQEPIESQTGAQDGIYRFHLYNPGPGHLTLPRMEIDCHESCSDEKIATWTVSQGATSNSQGNNGTKCRFLLAPSGDGISAYSEISGTLRCKVPPRFIVNETMVQSQGQKDLILPNPPVPLPVYGMHNFWWVAWLTTVISIGICIYLPIASNKKWTAHVDLIETNFKKREEELKDGMFFEEPKAIEAANPPRDGTKESKEYVDQIKRSVPPKT